MKEHKQKLKKEFKKAQKCCQLVGDIFWKKEISKAEKNMFI